MSTQAQDQLLRERQQGYFREPLAANPHIDAGLCSLLRQCREMVVRLGKTENALIRSLQQDRLLVVYRMAVDPGQTHFLTLDREACTAA